MNSDASERPTAGVSTPTPALGPPALTPVAPPTPGSGASAQPGEEVELWWGSYSGWTMMPSFVVCLLLTGLIGWAAWYFVPEGWAQLSALVAASVVWLVQ